MQRYYNLSDEQTEYQVSDRLSFQKFVCWTVADKVPDANTLWDFREALVSAVVFEKLLTCIKACLVPPRNAAARMAHYEQIVRLKLLRRTARLPIGGQAA